MRCGNCRKDHDTVAEVRSCYGVKAEQPQAEPAWRSDPLSEKQYNRLCKILADMGRQLASYEVTKDIITKGMASDAISTAASNGLPTYDGYTDGDPFQVSYDAKGIPIDTGWVPAAKPVAPVQVKVTAERYAAIPAGHYAVLSLTGNNDLDFFRVDKPEDGKWAGYIFVKRIVGGRPDIAVRTDCKMQALDAILKAGPDKAAQRYGQEIGRCYKCNRHLTDQTSRELGIGPDCRSRTA